MIRRFNSRQLFVPEPEPEPASPSSPSSGDDTKTEALPHKKRRGMKKRVVTIPIVDVDGSKGKGETYPPSDSWAWRKYGQKPIKGFPFPRGYYRCSSSKGCPARKQVERSHADPTMLVITYSSDHNHSLPIRKSPSSTAAAEAATPSSSSDGVSTPAAQSISGFPPEELTVFVSHPDLEFAGESVVLFSHHGEFGWLDDGASIGLLESPICGEVEDVTLTMREEDESLFADLGELPECSAVFRRRTSARSSTILCGRITG